MEKSEPFTFFLLPLISLERRFARKWTAVPTLYPLVLEALIRCLFAVTRLFNLITGKDGLAQHVFLLLFQFCCRSSSEYRHQTFYSPSEIMKMPFWCYYVLTGLSTSEAIWRFAVGQTASFRSSRWARRTMRWRLILCDIFIQKWNWNVSICVENIHWNLLFTNWLITMRILKPHLGNPERVYCCYRTKHTLVCSYPLSPVGWSTWPAALSC